MGLFGGSRVEVWVSVGENQGFSSGCEEEKTVPLETRPKRRELLVNKTKEFKYRNCRKSDLLRFCGDERTAVWRKMEKY